jgi:uncharacterized protein (DUF305 family)
MSHRFTRPALLVALAAGLTLPLGVGQAVAAPTAATSVKANSVDKAFVREMVPHHMMAVEMAKMAAMDGQHAKIRRLGRQISKAQTAEISTLTRIARRLGVTPETMSMTGDMSDRMMADLETLGVGMDESGMAMNMDDLHGAKQFDRAFIDMMIPHHQGAIRMARAERKRGMDAQLRRIASSIIKDQAKEIREMNAWRKAWYGNTSPGRRRS